MRASVAATAKGIKPILGSELYQAHGSRFDQTRTPNGDRYYHPFMLPVGHGDVDAGQLERRNRHSYACV